MDNMLIVALMVTAMIIVNPILYGNQGKKSVAAVTQQDESDDNDQEDQEDDSEEDEEAVSMDQGN